MQKTKKSTQSYVNYSFGISTEKKIHYFRHYHKENPSLSKKECLFQTHLYFSQQNDYYSRYLLTQLWHFALKK